MATLPANVETVPLQTPAPAVATDSPMMTGFSGLGVLRQIGLMVGLAASIALGFWIVLWAQEPDYQPVLTNMSNLDGTQAVDILNANDIPFKVDTRSGALMVAADRLHDARMQLAGAGISDNKSVGFELLDREQSLGTSQFMENISYRRGLEGELSRTVASLQSVRSARVHLAMPRASVFVRDDRKPSASVFVDLLAGRRLRDEQITAIVNLVASSVPEMDPADVTIVDQRGRLLSSDGQTEDSAMAATQFDYTRKLEEVLTKRVRAILAPVVGQDRFKAEVSADVDFTALEQTEEVFNPDPNSIRSEQTVQEQSSGSNAVGGVPGALSNQPQAPGAPEVAAGVTSQGESGSSRNQATRNFELDRTISYTRQQQGRVRRLSVAVVVDNIPGDDQTEAQPRSQEELDRLTQLVQGAVGYDPARGDNVAVVNAAFAPVEIIEPEIIEVPWWQQELYQKFMRQGLAALAVLLLIFAVIRPIMKSLSTAGSQQQALAMAAAGAGAGAGADAAAQAQAPAEAAAAQPPAAQAQLPPGAAQQQLLPGPGQNYDAQLNAVQGMVMQDPQRVAQVVKQWVAEDE